MRGFRDPDETLSTRRSPPGSHVTSFGKDDSRLLG
jgi:hypothetical protein